MSHLQDIAHHWLDCMMTGFLEDRYDEVSDLFFSSDVYHDLGPVHGQLFWGNNERLIGWIKYEVESNDSAMKDLWVDYLTIADSCGELPAILDVYE